MIPFYFDRMDFRSVTSRNTKLADYDLHKSHSMEFPRTSNALGRNRLLYLSKGNVCSLLWWQLVKIKNPPNLRLIFDGILSVLTTL
jgi:hypothetical protein